MCSAVGTELFCNESEIGVKSSPLSVQKLVSGSKAFLVGFAIFLVVLVVGLLAVVLHNTSDQNNSVEGTDSQLKYQSSPTLSAMAALASVVVFFLGLKLFFKKSPTRDHTNGY